jgi:hypothetical protein
MKTINLIAQPRKSLSWEEFLKLDTGPSVSLDGYCHDAPNYSEATKHVNFDHHHGVVREATMSTAEQVYMAIKGGLYESFKKDAVPFANVYINDCDQDTCLAIFILENYKFFEGASSIPHFNRLLNIDSKFDITGGAYPVNLRDELLEKHAWVFEPYTNIRKSGELATASAEVMMNCVEAVCARIHKFILGEAERIEMDTRHEILRTSSYLKGFFLVKETGGNSARYHLFSKGMNAFISVVAQKSDGKYVYSIGRKSRYIPFPIQEFFVLLNNKEGLTRQNGWGGSDIIGGSSRELGSSLNPDEVFDLIEEYLQKNKL